MAVCAVCVLDDLTSDYCCCAVSGARLHINSTISTCLYHLFVLLLQVYFPEYRSTKLAGCAVHRHCPMTMMHRCCIA